MTKENENIQQPESTADIASHPILKDIWSIRPCSAYKEEYDDCTSIKARFHQYFIHGENIDCSQWKTDYDNCERYVQSNGNDVNAAQEVILSEAARRKKRLDAHYSNTTWQRRTHPPEDWSKPLPEWFVERNKNTFLEIKQMELNGEKPAEENEKSYCAIM